MKELKKHNIQDIVIVVLLQIDETLFYVLETFNDLSIKGKYSYTLYDAENYYTECILNYQNAINKLKNK